MADGVATGCLVMGKEKAIEFLDAHREFEAFMVYSDESGNYKTWISDKLRRYLSVPENNQ
jgi:thiamine biosynthesis lipoprotein